MKSDDPSTTEIRKDFPETEWTAFVGANGTGEAARSAMEALCKRYWQPVFTYFARRIPDTNKAKDLTQDFFTLVVQNGDVFLKADKNRGKFRVFIIGRLKWILSDDRRRDASRSDTLERFLKNSPPNNATADEIVSDIDLAWAQRTVDLVRARLEDLYRETGNKRRLDVLTHYSLGPTEISSKLSLDLDTAKNEIRAINRDSQTIFRQTIRSQVLSDDLVDEEIDTLKDILSRGTRQNEQLLTPIKKPR